MTTCKQGVQPVSTVKVVMSDTLHVCLTMGMHVLMSDKLQLSPVNHLPSHVSCFHVSLCFSLLKPAL